MKLRAWIDRLLPPDKPAPQVVPIPDKKVLEQADENRLLRKLLDNWLQRPTDDSRLDEFMLLAAEMVEAKAMRGSGPWRPASAEGRQQAIESLGRIRENVTLREGNPIAAQGAFGDIELALQNVEWRREINLSWLEFTRWGIQQIILISRLYYIKNPLIQRGVNVYAHYVFGRGVEISSPDEDANAIIEDFCERNRKTIGQVGLVALQKRHCYDGQVFFCLTDGPAGVNLSTIDATEIQDIITDPDDTDTPWFYRRQWTRRIMDPGTGNVTTVNAEAWYPALDYEPAERLPTINGHPVKWASPVYHMRSGTGVSKWHFDVPIVYAALDWAKAARRFLEACATVKQALAQIAMTLTTKGGQQAIEGMKQQLQTTVNSGPGQSLWDTNPTAVNASIAAFGPGTKLEVLNTKGGGGNPEEVRRFIHMVAMVFGIPETFFADASTGSLATAQSLDRPTELCFLEWQERWRDALVTLIVHVLKRAQGNLVSGKQFRAAAVREASRRQLGNGRWVYEASKESDDVQVLVTFPAIREGDLPALIKAITEAMTLDNKGGQIVGIDEKVGVRLLLEQLGVEDAEKIVEEMYPADEYDPDRTEQELTAPIPKLQDAPGGTTQIPDRDGNPLPPAQQAQESFKRLLEAARKFGREVA